MGKLDPIPAQPPGEAFRKRDQQLLLAADLLEHLRPGRPVVQLGLQRDQHRSGLGDQNDDIRGITCGRQAREPVPGRAERRLTYPRSVDG